MATLTRRTSNAVAGILALTLTAGLVIRTSSATFTASTNNTGNSLEAGTVTLTDDDGSGSALLQLTNVAPGESTSNCIEVTYGGTLDPTVVKVYSSSSLTQTVAGMDALVNITIEEGTAGSTGSFNDCSGFVADGAPIVDATVASWDGVRTYVDGSGSWDPSVQNESRLYRVTLGLDEATGNAYQGASLSGIAITWEVQSAPAP